MKLLIILCLLSSSVFATTIIPNTNVTNNPDPGHTDSNMPEYVNPNSDFPENIPDPTNGDNVTTHGPPGSNYMGQ